MQLEDSAMVPVQDEEEPTPQPWTLEPATLHDLQDLYIIESKMSGRQPGTSLFLVQAERRDGSKVDMLDGQRFKLFLAPWLMEWI